MEDLPAIPLFMMNFPTPYRAEVWAGLPDRDPIWAFDLYVIEFMNKK